MPYESAKLAQDALAESGCTAQTGNRVEFIKYLIKVCPVSVCVSLAKMDMRWARPRLTPNRRASAFVTGFGQRCAPDARTTAPPDSRPLSFTGMPSHRRANDFSV